MKKYFYELLENEFDRSKIDKSKLVQYSSIDNTVKLEGSFSLKDIDYISGRMAYFEDYLLEIYRIKNLKVWNFSSNDVIIHREFVKDKMLYMFYLKYYDKLWDIKYKQSNGMEAGDWWPMEYGNKFDINLMKELIPDFFDDYGNVYFRFNRKVNNESLVVEFLRECGFNVDELLT